MDRNPQAEIQAAELYRSLIEASPDPILMYDLRGRIVTANLRTAQVYGAASVPELLARAPTVFDLLTPECRERAVANFARTLETGTSRRNEYTVIIANGERLTVEIHSAVVRDADGAPRGFVSVVRDITGHKQLEEHLRCQTELAERLARSDDPEAALQICLEAAIAHSEADAGLVGVVGDDGWLQIIARLGLRSPELLALRRLSPESRQLEVLRSGEVFYTHTRDAPEPGREASLAEGLRATVLVPVMIAERPVAALVLMSHQHDEFNEDSRRWIESVGTQVTGYLRHHSEKRRIEAQLQHAIKMEAVGRLAGGVAHDFNNLLTGILGNLSLALLDLGEASPLRPLLAEANRAAESAAGLVRQLLAFSRKQIVEPRLVDVNELLGGFSRMLDRLIGEDVALSVRASGAPAWVLADPGQLEQILVNLVVNARDAMPSGGAIVIETSRARLDADYCRKHPGAVAGEHVTLSVSDTGQGMSREVRERVFEPFFTTKAGGTGLGLATTYGTVKQLGGTIEVYSEPGRGTTFRIYLPAAAGSTARDARARDARDPDDDPRGDERVLVVEDDPIVRELARTLLGRLGYRVAVAADGPEALRIAAQPGVAFDLLMTDVVMPGMNGKELADRMRALHPELAVLFTSGYTEEVIVHHGVVEPGIHFLAKPYVQSRLARKVREALERG